MRNIGTRLNKAEKALHVEEPHLVNIEGIEIMSDELDKLINKIQAESKGIPIRKRTAT